MSRSKNTARSLSDSARKTGSLTEHRSSPISEHSSVTGTPQAIREWLTSLRAGFPAKTSPVPEKVKALPASDPGCGKKWRKPFALYDRASATWKTPQCSLFEDSMSCSVTWPRWGTMRSGACWERLTPVRRTRGKEYGLWHTPTAEDCQNREFARNSRGEPKLSAQAAYGKNALWPTPDTHQGHHGGQSYMGAVRRAAKGKQIELRDRVVIENGAGGQLNPDWVCWLMGWPCGWTALGPLNPQAFREWLQAFKTGWQD